MALSPSQRNASTHHPASQASPLARCAGIKGKMFAKKRHAEKVQMKKTIAMHQERENKHKADDGVPKNALPAYLLEREQVRSSILALSISHPRWWGRLNSWGVASALSLAGGPCKGAEQHDQAEEEGEGRQVGGPAAQGSGSAGRRDVQGKSARHLGSLVPLSALLLITPWFPFCGVVGSSSGPDGASF